MIKLLSLFISVLLLISTADARIRNRKVKEAPKSCKLMEEDALLSRSGKKVFGTLRHSLVFEKNETSDLVSLIKDKGEKICEWSGDQWGQILRNNQVESAMNFKFHIDEHKEILFPYVHKADGSYFLLSIPFATCALDNQVTKEKLEIPKCEKPKKAKKRRKKKTA